MPLGPNFKGTGLFSLSITIPELRLNVYSSVFFTEVGKFYMDRVVPINHSWHQKTRDTGLLDGEDRIPLLSLVLTQYRSVVNIQTDMP